MSGGTRDGKGIPLNDAAVTDNGYSDRNMIENLSKFVGDPEHSAIRRLAEGLPEEAV